MRIDTAPWTGWLRIAIPLLQCIILLANVTVIALGAASSAVIERQWNLPYLAQIDQTSLPETSYTSTHEMKVRMYVCDPTNTLRRQCLETDFPTNSQLVCFYMLAPMIMACFVVGEMWCLITNDLAPVYVIVASILSMAVWALELGFWTVCHYNSGDAVPDMCPVIFKRGKDEFFTISGLGIAQAAVYMAAALIGLCVSLLSLLACKSAKRKANSSSFADT